MQNNKSLASLPNSMVDNMKSLVYITNCSLTALPPRLEQLTEMVDFEVSFNHLRRFDVDVSKWTKVNRIMLMFNNISSCNSRALWTHNGIAALSLQNNSLTRLSDVGEIYMPSLNFLQLSDNNMTIDVDINVEAFPALLDLWINGNTIETFPSEDLKFYLAYLAIARCGLRSLPSYLASFASLEYLDARDNYLSSIDGDLKKVIVDQRVEAYFSGNDALCKSDQSLDCTPLCSKTCWSRMAANNKHCDIECNSQECSNDGGECNVESL